MSPRLIDTDRCPHCRCELPAERPRSCPECGGSLQQRYLRSGCLTSAPPTVLLLVAAALAARALVAPPAAERPAEQRGERRVQQGDASPGAEGGARSIALPARRP